MSSTDAKFANSSPAGLSAMKRRVALHSMMVAAAMTVLKLAAGLFSGSLGVLSDAAHSGLDLVAVMLTFFSVQVSDKPADEDHTYGHGKIENLSAFGEAVLMVASPAYGSSGRRWRASFITRWNCAIRFGRCWCC